MLPRGPLEHFPRTRARAPAAEERLQVSRARHVPFFADARDASAQSIESTGMHIAA